MYDFCTFDQVVWIRQLKIDTPECKLGRDVGSFYNIKGLVSYNFKEILQL